MHLIISTHTLGDLPAVLENIIPVAASIQTVVVSSDAVRADVADHVRQIRNRFSCPLVLVQRSHKGEARRGQTRNNGVRAIRSMIKDSDMLYFLDGDICPDQKHFNAVQEEQSHDVVIGRVVRLSAAASTDFKQHLFAGKRFYMPLVQKLAFIKKVGKAKATCWARQLDIPLLGKRLPPYWPDLRSGNCAVRARRFFCVNGFDEAMVGWGAEDSDLGLRLYREGATVTTFPWGSRAFHLWHATAAGTATASHLKDRLSVNGHWAIHGLESAFDQDDLELQVNR